MQPINFSGRTNYSAQNDIARQASLYMETETERLKIFKNEYPDDPERVEEEMSEWRKNFLRPVLERRESEVTERLESLNKNSDKLAMKITIGGGLASHIAIGVSIITAAPVGCIFVLPVATFAWACMLGKKTADSMDELKTEIENIKDELEQLKM